jgi:uncharacterized protein (TIGR02271 family)
MRNTVVGYFTDMSEAARTQEHLIQSGFDPRDIEVLAQQEAAQPAEEAHEEQPGMLDRIKHALGFASHEERAQYEAAARHGGALVVITVEEEQVEPAASIIEQHHPSDLEQHAGEADEVLGASTETTAAEPEEGVSVPVVEEELQVGRRAVRRGGVRIHERVTDTPVEERVTLKEERAWVERRPADRPATPEDQAFQEREIRVTEMAEEPVVAKEARVVEEVSVGKDVHERQETVRDTVRKTDVEVTKEEDDKP